MHETEGDAVVAEFIRNKGITRCPTACVSPTQAAVAAADRAALEEYALARDRSRRAKLASRSRSFWMPGHIN
jgi:7-keto-8-aminopelargonate synthetase-like enzyme